MYLLLVVEYGGRFAIGIFKPLTSLETPPGAMGNYVLVAVGLVLWMLSLRRRSEAAATPWAAERG